MFLKVDYVTDRLKVSVTFYAFFLVRFGAEKSVSTS